MYFRVKKDVELILCEELRKIQAPRLDLDVAPPVLHFDTHVGDVSWVDGQGPAGVGLPWTQVSRQLQPRRLHGEEEEEE